MDLDYFLVLWIKEKPVRHSVMSRNDIADPEERKKDQTQLIDLEVEFKWKTRICVGKIVSYGPKKDLESQALQMIQAKKQTSHASKRQRFNKVLTHSSAILAKKSKIDATLSARNETEQVDRLQILEEELASERELRKAAEEKLKEMETFLQERVDDGSEIDIGNGVFVKKETLTTMRAVSTTMNIYARNLFKYLFQAHEVVGYSLMGKGCNVNRSTPKLPSIDPKRRDAIIAYTLSSFGRQPGTELFKLGMKDLKRSLSCLIQEITVESKKTEETLMDENVENEQN